MTPEPTPGVVERGSESPSRREQMIAGDPGSRSPAERARWLRKWALLILSAFVVAIIPWTAYLTRTLPAEHVTRHWDIAWAGFDLAIAAAAAATVIGVVRRSRRLAVLASATGTLLLCDAWFDVVTARPGSELAWASGEALLGELPLAALCYWIARDAEKL